MRRAPAAVLAVLLLRGLPTAFAADLSGIYDRSTLAEAAARYQRSTTKIMDQAIWPALRDEQRRQLGQKPALAFPLWADAPDLRGHPLAFYTPTRSHKIVLPVLSLKFLDDLCTAYAWLQTNGYNIDTISEYTAILKYGRPPAGGFPPPLKALGVPQNALKDPRVDELALDHFVTARTFILLHELGHIFHGHAARTLEQSVQNETEADQFAATVMKRTGLPPNGILLFFMADAHWSDFAVTGDHPLSGKRVAALATHVDPVLGKLLTDLGKLLDDPDVRRGFVATGVDGILPVLPRRIGELLSPRPGARPGTAPFDGMFRGDFLLVNDPERKPMPIEFDLNRQGDRVNGRYSFGVGPGKIAGRMDGQALHVEWKWAGNSGRGVLVGRDDGSVTGTWGNGEARAGAGTLTARRKPNANRP